VAISETFAEGAEFSAGETLIKIDDTNYLLTSVTTIVGLMPMMLDRSMQAAFLQPIVVALAFGVFFAFFVTLLLVPSLYGIGLDVSAFSSQLKKRCYLLNNSVKGDAEGSSMALQ
jgi:hypothetical protein